MLLSLTIKLLLGIRIAYSSFDFVHSNQMENLMEDFSANERKTNELVMINYINNTL